MFYDYYQTKVNEIQHDLETIDKSIPYADPAEKHRLLQMQRQLVVELKNYSFALNHTKKSA